MSRFRPQPQQRRFRRRLVRVLVDYLADGAPRCEYATTLGAGGLFIETEAPLTLGSPVRVRFRLPGGASLHAIEGRVTWQHRGAQAARGNEQAARSDDQAARSDDRAPGMGVEFTDAAAASRLARELEALADG